MGGSEVARTRQRIDLETRAAAQALEGFAVVARHAIITARMERMTDHITALFKAGLHEEARNVLESNDLWDMDIYL